MIVSGRVDVVSEEDSAHELVGLGVLEGGVEDVAVDLAESAGKTEIKHDKIIEMKSFRISF